MSTDEMVAKLARLTARVEALEHAAFAKVDEYVEGWSNAARVVGRSAATCKRRYNAGNFPRPCRIETIARADQKDHERPTWRRADLVAYAEGKFTTVPQ